MKEAGRRLREEKERELEERERARLRKTRVEAEPQPSMEEAEAPPSLGPYDTTIRVKFPLAKYPALDTPSALAGHFRRFGEIDEGAIVLSLKPKKSGKKDKAETPAKDSKMMVNAVVTFTQISAAFGAVSSGPKLKEQGMDVSWAGGTEPPILQWLRDHGQLGGNTSRMASPPNGSTEDNQGKAQTANLEDGSKFSSFPSTFVSLFRCCLHAYILTPSCSRRRTLRTHAPRCRPQSAGLWITNLLRYFACGRRNVQSWNAKY